MPPDVPLLQVLRRRRLQLNKYFENGTFDSDETMFCRLSKQAVIDVVLAKLENKATRPFRPFPSQRPSPALT